MHNTIAAVARHRTCLGCAGKYVDVPVWPTVTLPPAAFAPTLLQEMKLALFRDGQYVMDYLAFMVARRTAPGTINQIIGTSKKILQFLDGRDAAPWPHSAALSMAYSRQVHHHGEGTCCMTQMMHAASVNIRMCARARAGCCRIDKCCCNTFVLAAREATVYVGRVTPGREYGQHNACVCRLFMHNFAYSTCTLHACCIGGRYCRQVLLRHFCACGT